MNIDTPTITETRVTDLPRLYATLTKARLSVLVVVTTAVGFIMASGLSIQWWLLLWTVLGTMACALSANALNQVFETHRDKLMERTRGRPTPSGALSTRHAFIFAVLVGYGGLLVLALLVNLAAAGLALLTILLYLLGYTPLKPISTLNTIVGAVVGGIPPIIGWVAVREQFEVQAWVLGGLLFVWQLPHFLSLAWLYRDQYAGAGFRMLPVIKGGDHLTVEVTLLTTLLLIPLGLSVTLSGMAGFSYAIISIALGLGFTWFAIRFFQRRDRPSARSTFLFSLLYLPVLMAAMVADRAIVTEGELINVEMNPDAIMQYEPGRE
ncbi:MAG: heme o synthase [Planctomycetota bacterium]|nr:heme o synthase [Planctomycetota bacterium]